MTGVGGEARVNVGFIGLGVMGQPMALNLVRSGTSLVVWNRTTSKSEALRAVGATVVAEPADVFARCPIVLLMLADEPATDAILARGTAKFATYVHGHTIVHMGTTSPDYSHGLEGDVRAAGGSYVEAPVSGSRVSAENSQLVGMLAGDDTAVEAVRPLLMRTCQHAIVCGPVPNAVLMKLAVNIFLITMVTGLAEAVHFAEQNELELSLLQEVLDAGPMASQVSRGKIAKLVGREFSVQASIANVLESNRLVAEAARTRCLASPLLDACHALYSEALALGHGTADMAAVVHAIEARTGAVP